MIHGDGGKEDNEGEKPIPRHLTVDQKHVSNVDTMLCLR